MQNSAIGLMSLLLGCS